MNNSPQRNLFPFRFVRHIQIHVHIDRKIFFQQRIVFLFGAERLREILESPDPIILPFLMYEHSFDMYVFILF